MRLAELGNLLQTRGDPGEAYEVIEQVVISMFPGLSGALYLFNASRNLLEVKRLGDSICIPMAAHGETLGMLHLMDHNLQPGQQVQQGRMLTEANQQLGVAVAKQTSLALANIQMRAALRQLALRDQMTGLFNRRIVE